MNIDKPVLVSGASGFIASWIVKKLLDKGYTVHGTVRDLSKEDKVAHLQQMAEDYPGKLKLFEADLLKKGSFEEGMAGCGLVIHTASPFFVQGVEDAQKQLIEPAQQGTREVLQTANQVPDVQRIVLTSSVAAIFGDHTDKPKGEEFTEADWNSTASASYQPYAFSKTLAEKEAWKIAEEQDQWDLITINPSFVQGPSLSRRKDPTSMGFVLNMVQGQFKSGAPGMNFGWVDVREVADAHILAAEKPEAKGRYILSAEEKSVMEVANIIRQGYEKELPLPKSKLPKAAMYIFGPLNGFSWRYVRNNIDVPIAFDNSKSQIELGITYRPVEETVMDVVRDFEDKGWIG